MKKEIAGIARINQEIYLKVGRFGAATMMLLIFSRSHRETEGKKTILIVGLMVTVFVMR